MEEVCLVAFQRSESCLQAHETTRTNHKAKRPTGRRNRCAGKEREIFEELNVKFLSFFQLKR